MKIEIKKIHIENFKGCKCKDIDFATKTKIAGRNASGKTTIFDAVTWVLFGKNSLGAEKFDLRPLDKDGKPINFVEIMVSAIFDIDGKEVELKKVQKQNWTKQRGSENAVFQGNINEYLIDGFPKTEKEYKSFIAEIIDADLFRILTNPLFFPNMEWKKQREMLMKCVSEFTDIELANKFGGYEELIADLEKATCTDDIAKKYAKALKELKAKQTEIPVRIDELEKQKIDIDVAELELQKNEIKERMVANGSVAQEIDALKTERFEHEFKVNDYVRKANELIYKRHSDAENDYINLKHEYGKTEIRFSSLDSNIENAEERVALLTQESMKLGETYKTEKAKKFDESVWVFDESSTVCKMCGQKLPNDKIDELKNAFAKNHDNAVKEFTESQNARLESLKKRGFEIKAEIDAKNEEIKKYTTEKNRVEEMLNSYLSSMNKAKETLDTLPASADLSNDAEYKKLIDKRTELDTAIANAENKTADTSLDSELAEVESKLAQASNNNNIDDRISELRSEQREIAQTIANAEKMVYLLENYVKAKLDYVSQSINSKFDGITFKLFNTQINGGISDTCEVSVNGVPFAGLNSGHKIQAGIQIIKGLEKIFDMSAPIFVDNAETINNANIPATDSQLILLTVTEDNELKVEVG